MKNKNYTEPHTSNECCILALDLYWKCSSNRTIGGDAIYTCHSVNWDEHFHRHSNTLVPGFVRYIYTLYMCYIYSFCFSVSSYRLLISRRSNERSKSRIQQLNSQKITSCSMPRAWSTLPFDQQFFFCLSPSYSNILQVLFIVFFYIYLTFFGLRTFF